MTTSDRSERRVITCLFVDIVGSTDLVARQGPERMKRALDEAFGELRTRIEAAGGTVEKYVGDAIFALFGAPTAHTDDPRRALSAAAACIDWAREDGAKRGIAVRIGVETGEALIDLAAMETERQRMAVGACVNVAARLQQLAEPGEILVGPVCREATTGAAEFGVASARDLKGVGKMEAAPLIRVSSEPERIRLPFVGRARELARLAELGARSRRGQAQLVLILGPPGQGKSRLAEEFVATIEGDARVLRARCRPGSELGTQTPLRQLLASDILEPSPDTIAARCEDLLLRGTTGERVAEVLAHTTGIAISERLLSLHALERQNEFAGGWRTYLEALSRDRLVAASLEDLHWADPQLVRLIDRLTFAAPFPLFVLATARPEVLDAVMLRPGDDRTIIELGGLDEAAGHELGHSAGALDPHALARAAGNPLFIVELARMRASAGLPATLQGAIDARLDELAPTDRELLQRASVAGETFAIRDAALLTERGSGEVAGTLGRLVHLRYLESVDGAFRFYHPLVHDVAYGRLPIAERMRLHARYAREGAYPEDAEALAHHWWQALRPPDGEWVWEGSADLPAMRREALAALLAAGERYAARNSHERAIELLDRALALAVDPADLARTEDALANAYQRSSQGDESWKHRLRALEAFGNAASRMPAKSYADMLEIPMFNFGFFRELPDGALIARLLDAGIEAARAEGDDVSLARLLVQRSSFTSDAAPVEEALAIIDVAPDARPHADALFRAAEHFIRKGRDIARANVLYERVDELVARSARINESEMLLWRVLVDIGVGQLDAARAVSERLDEIVAGRSAHLRGHALGVAATIALAKGDWKAVAQIATKTEELAMSTPVEIPFCLIAAAAVAYGAAGEIRAGRPAPPRLRELVQRISPQSVKVCASTRFLPEAMQGRADELADVLDTYLEKGTLWDNSVWDPWRVLLVIALVILERWSDIDPHLEVLDETARSGGRGAGAVAEAVREERAAARGGPAPTHAALRALGLRGYSELLRYRPVSRPGGSRSSTVV